ncbi:MAG: hypothetical protein GY859_26605 [Desulfobacterales bacterium]|nr:hypothetical protein [Desulfobacterales bacterium]
MKSKNNDKWIVETVVPGEVYTDRKEFLDYFYNAALNAIGRRTMSSVLLGQRRMGKTEIFKRVVNRLFTEQDHEDPRAAVPVYYQFPDETVGRKDFAVDYIVNFIRWWAAFRTGDESFLSHPKAVRELIALVEKRLEITKGFYIAIDLLRAILNDDAVLPEKQAVAMPREIAAMDDVTIVMFLDEFQNTRLPHRDFSVTGFFQQAVESPTCPHFVTGSALSILADEILGKGALYGRFRSRYIEPFTDYYGKELALRAAKYYQAEIPEIMAPVLSHRCGGNPFYITAVIQQAAEQDIAIEDEKTVNKLLAIDISSGFIWAELSDQVNRWIERVNKLNITKWVLFLAAMEEGREIDLERIRKELYEREKIEASIQEIKDVLVKLARGDLLEYKSFGAWFGKIKDPILNEFLKVWGQIEVEKQTPRYIEEKTVKKFKRIKKRFDNYKGYLAETYMIQVLWNSQRKTLPGKFFHRDEDIVMPERFYYIDQRHRPGAGKKVEVDIHGGAGSEKWLAESKWWTKKKIGPDTVETLLEQADVVKEREGEDLETLRLWIFAYDGATGPAMELMKEHGVLWSTRAELDGLLETARLRKLPVLE